MDALYTRRSVRKFTEKPVSEEDLDSFIAAGMMAPSAGNQQPWHFVTVTDPSTLRSIGDINPNAKMAARAPAAVLVCGEIGREMHPGYWVQDCTAAVENILLAVHGKGLGAVWTGIWPREDRVAGFRDLFRLPETVNPLALIVIGHPEETSERRSPPDRFQQNRIHREIW